MLLQRFQLKPFTTLRQLRWEASSKSAEGFPVFALLRRNFSLQKLNNESFNAYKMDELKSIPPILFSTNYKYLKHLYLIDRREAKAIFDIIKPSLQHTKEMKAIEVAPGLGFLTVHLNKFYNNVYCFEPLTEFKNVLEQKFDRIHVVNKSFENIWKSFYADQFDNENRIGQDLHFLETVPWEADPAIVIFGIFSKPSIISFYLWSIIFEKEIYLFGRPIMYVMVTPLMYLLLTATNKSSSYIYRWRSVLFQLFFDCRLISKHPRTAFLPPPSLRKIKKAFCKEVFVDRDSIYLIEIIAKKEYPLERRQLTQFWYFLHQVMQVRAQRLLPFLERWIPDFGKSVILSNQNPNNNPNFIDIDIYTQVKDIHPDQLLFLFQQFSRSPEYQDCAFIPSMKEALDKIQTIVAADYGESENVEEETEIDDENQFSSPVT